MPNLSTWLEGAIPAQSPCGGNGTTWGGEIRVGEHRETSICPCADQEHKRWRPSADELLTLEALACGVAPHKAGWRRQQDHLRAAGFRLALFRSVRLCVAG